MTGRQDGGKRREYVRGRGAVSNVADRFQRRQHERFDDGWGSLDREAASTPDTVLGVDRARKVISYNRSPDIPFDRSINPYRGCEHGCIYCYARPTHAYLDLSPGLDFETRILYKPDAAERLREELANPRYQCAPIALGVNTDAYQPAERRLRLTRAILEVLWEHRHPVTLITKSGLIERDLDLLQAMAAEGLASASVSITTLDGELDRTLEPRAAGPRRRLRTVERLAAAGIPTGVMVAPVIPAINDGEIESIIEAAAGCGAITAGYVVLRLPHEVRPLFEEWLRTHRPLRADHVLSLVRQLRGGRSYDARFGARMRGEGVFARLIARRFRLACERTGLNRNRAALDCGRFRRPASPGGQLSLL